MRSTSPASEGEFDPEVEMLSNVLLVSSLGRALTVFLVIIQLSSKA